MRRDGWFLDLCLPPPQGAQWPPEVGLRAEYTFQAAGHPEATTDNADHTHVHLKTTLSLQCHFQG